MADENPTPPLCACGCGLPVTQDCEGKRWNKFIGRHNTRVQPSGSEAHRWRGGRRGHHGWVEIYMPDHPRAIGNYVRRSLVVAEAMLGRPLRPKEVVHHKNQQRDDDRPENLHVFPSQSEHVAHHNRSIKRAKKLTEDQVREIKQLLQQSLLSCRSIGRRFGVAGETIRSIRKGRYWKHI